MSRLESYEFQFRFDACVIFDCSLKQKNVLSMEIKIHFISRKQIINARLKCSTQEVRIRLVIVLSQHKCSNDMQTFVPGLRVETRHRRANRQ